MTNIFNSSPAFIKVYPRIPCKDCIKRYMLLQNELGCTLLIKGVRLIEGQIHGEDERNNAQHGIHAVLAGLRNEAAGRSGACFNKASCPPPPSANSTGNPKALTATPPFLSNLFGETKKVSALQGAYRPTDLK
jgi:hypothetical protein